MLNLVHEGERDRGSYNHCTQSEPQGTGNKKEKQKRQQKENKTKTNKRKTG